MSVNQMKYEKDVNRKMQAYLDLTLRLTHEHQKGKWKYSDAEDFFNELKKRKETAYSISETGQTKDRRASVISAAHDGTNKTINEAKNFSEGSATSKFMNKQVEKSHASKKDESEGGFAAVLGLPTITVETLYQQYKEKDESIIEIMNEHANYVKLYEGYPEFIVEM